MERIVRERFGLDAAVAAKMIATAQSQLAASLEDWIFADAVRDGYTAEERAEILGLLWEVVYADGRPRSIRGGVAGPLGERVERGRGRARGGAGAGVRAVGAIGRRRGGMSRARVVAAGLCTALAVAVIALAQTPPSAARAGAGRVQRSARDQGAAARAHADRAAPGRGRRLRRDPAVRRCGRDLAAGGSGRHAQHDHHGGLRRSHARLGRRARRRDHEDRRRRRNLDAAVRRRSERRAAIPLVRERGPRHRGRRVRLRDRDPRRWTHLEANRDRRRRRSRPAPQRHFRHVGEDADHRGRGGHRVPLDRWRCDLVDAAPAVRGLDVGRDPARQRGRAALRHARARAAQRGRRAHVDRGRDRNRPLVYRRTGAPTARSCWSAFRVSSPAAPMAARRSPRRYARSGRRCPRSARERRDNSSRSAPPALRPSPFPAK